MSPPDEHDDAFINYVGGLVDRVAGLEKMLGYIRANLGQVCQNFEICHHRACNASCTAWLIADAALEGNYLTPDEERAALRAAS